MTSCASILNQKHKTISIYTTKTTKIIYKTDTLKTSNNKTNIRVDRSNNPIKIIAKTDSLTKTIEIKPKNSPLYWYNIGYNFGIGMLIDQNNPKRYTYPGYIYINSSDTISKYSTFKQNHYKGEIDLHVSLPYINSFLLKPENEGVKSNTGFMGFTIGCDYYHSKNQFLNLGFSIATDFFLPGPAVVDFSGEKEFMSSKYISLSNNHKIKRFTLGYGFSYSKNTWDYQYYDMLDPPPPTKDPVKKSHNAFGLIFPTYYQIGNYFNIGIIYKPTFYRPQISNKLDYEHLFSIDFAWKIPLKIWIFKRQI